MTARSFGQEARQGLLPPLPLTPPVSVSASAVERARRRYVQPLAVDNPPLVFPPEEEEAERIKEENPDPEEDHRARPGVNAGSAEAQRESALDDKHDAEIEGLWSAVPVYTALMVACLLGIFGGIVSLILLLLVVIPEINQPFVPLDIVPSYGTVYVLPHVLEAVLNIGATSMQKTGGIVVILLYNVLVLALDLFCVGMLTAWIYYYYTGLLSVANSNNQSIATALLDIGLTVLMLFLGMLAILKYGTVIASVNKGDKRLRRQWEERGELRPKERHEEPEWMRV